VSFPWSITLEEHFTSKLAIPDEPAKYAPLDGFIDNILPQLADLYDGRIANLDKNGIAIQVVSHSPNANLTNDGIKAANDQLAQAIQKHPNRLAGFALLQMSDPVAAIAELERCINELGFIGALVDNHAGDNFYDSKEYDAFWAKVEALDVPLYLHPSFPSVAMKQALYSGGGLDSNPAAATSIGTFGFGWHSSTATSILRLLGSGLFDKHKNLKIIIGHTGELLPIMFERIDRISQFYVTGRTFADVMRKNIWITTSGMFDIPSLKCVLSWMPLERVMFSVDYPYSQNEQGRAYLTAIQQQKALSTLDLQKFACDNAKQLLFNRKRG
jgi:predicted TIM-barrel fold metal-dependent hydrolase